MIARLVYGSLAATLPIFIFAATAFVFGFHTEAFELVVFATFASILIPIFVTILVKRGATEK